MEGVLGSGLVLPFASGFWDDGVESQCFGFSDA